MFGINIDGHLRRSDGAVATDGCYLCLFNQDREAFVCVRKLDSKKWDNEATM